MCGPREKESPLVKYLKIKWLGLTNHFDISFVFEISDECSTVLLFN